MSYLSEKIFANRNNAHVFLSIVVMVVTLLFSFGTISRNHVWRDDLSLWSDTVLKSPNSYVVHSELAFSYKEKGILDSAVEHYNTALAYNQQHYISHNGIGKVYMEKGDYDKAIEHFQYAINLKPAAAELYMNLAGAYKKKGWNNMADEYIKKAEEIRAGVK